MKRAIGYIRVSTDEQSREGISMDMQQSKIRAYCELNDLVLGDIIEDAGISAKNVKGRPGVQRVLFHVTSRSIDAVVVYKLDRLARNTVECLKMAEDMDKAGVALHSITEKLDTQSALGRFFFTLTASLAEMERSLIAERTTAALSEKRARGEKTGGSDPYGFRSVGGKLELIPTEQRAIARMRELRAKGYAYRRIASTLTKEGTMTRKGTRWCETQIIRILERVA